MENLPHFCLSDEAEYIKKFCELYADEIKTPDDLSIICRDLEKTARHFCCGGNGCIFQPARAQRIGWAKYILLHPDERKILLDTETKKIIFFFEHKRTAFAVICVPIKENQLNLISGFVVGGKRAIAYREGKKPYEFYVIKKSC